MGEYDSGLRMASHKKGKVSAKNGNGKKAGTPETREPARTPGDILRRSFMEPLGLSAYRVSLEIGVPQITLSHILRGNRGISPGVAVRLGLYFGVAPQFWLALQADYDLSRISVDAEELQVEKCAALGDRQFTLKPPEKPPLAQAAQAAQAAQRVVLIKFQQPVGKRAG